MNRSETSASAFSLLAVLLAIAVGVVEFRAVADFLVYTQHLQCGLDSGEPVASSCRRLSRKFGLGFFWIVREQMHLIFQSATYMKRIT